MTSIALEHVTKWYPRPIFSRGPDVLAIDDLSIQIPSGEVFAVLGPSGCGKTTLLRLMAGLSKPDSGEIRLDGTLLKDIPVEDRGIGVIFQSGGFHPGWKTRRSVGFYLELRKRQDELPERLDEISKITGIGLDRLLERRPRDMSHGELQRVSIARALARDLRVLLLDEPFANIDAQLRTQARIELKRLLGSFPTTTVYFTHEQSEAMATADRIAIMDRGGFEQVGSYTDLFESPKNLFVATFIGTPTMNQFVGKAVQGAWTGGCFGGFPIRRDLADGQPVILGIRPEDIQPDERGVEGRITQLTPLYAEGRIIATLESGGESWQLYLPYQDEWEMGSRVRCSPDPERIHYFDAETGVRIG
jgi:ABC-type sugar transport system ATPase subunit